jgi:hypothetical protein
LTLGFLQRRYLLGNQGSSSLGIPQLSFLHLGFRLGFSLFERGLLSLELF